MLFQKKFQEMPSTTQLVRSESGWLDMVDSLGVLSEEEQQQDSRLVFRDREVLTSRLLLSLSLPSMASLMQEQGDQVLLLPFTDSQEMRRSIRGFLAGRWLARRSESRQAGDSYHVEKGTRGSDYASKVKEIIAGGPSNKKYSDNVGMEGMKPPEASSFMVDADGINQNIHKLDENTEKSCVPNELEQTFKIWKTESEGDILNCVDEASIKQEHIEKVNITLGLETVYYKKDKKTVSRKYKNTRYSGVTLATRHMFMNRVEGKYVCTLCGATANGPKGMMEHLERHIRGQNYKCDICILSKSFSCQIAVRRHKKVRHGILPNTRQRRTREEAREARIEKEKIKIQEEKNSKKDPEYPKNAERANKRYTCLCGESFHKLFNTPGQNTVSFKNHIREEHSPDSLEYSHFLSLVNAFHTARNTCQFCKKYFEAKVELKEHLKTYINQEGNFDCQEPGCSRIFRPSDPFHPNSSSAFKKHMMIHRGEINNVTCPTCGKGFLVISQLKAHLTMHSKPSFKCDLCPKLSKSKEYLRSHMLTHTNETVFICEQCEKTFKREYTLKRHINSHHETNSYECETCGKLFKEKSSVKCHQREVHQGERKHRCDQCDMRFFDKPKLSRHYMLHTKERPFMCENCNKGFIQKCNRNEHQVNCKNEKMP